MQVVKGTNTIQESKPHPIVPQTAQSDMWQNVYLQ